MITPRDLRLVGKLAPVAQLLELLGNQDKPVVRCPEVFASMSKELWAVFMYLNARLHDELFGPQTTVMDEAYQLDLENQFRDIS